ncbi:FAD-dependent oxidoreductase [Marivita sp. XM-24bin2]|jgi:glycine/D-amino acid oxidase-like deaminating enzyme|uniref:NAD(P)/FAD-dependent oxidoreductase n=1 Tax=unclassified Marivita TaxID=2632480 RepID=UPI000D79DB30|nr:FAD-dependent oxidoreductase [Marivita sp. XM-24bin2]MCR9110444.1 FAD-binding oxidoreductase [Paracoccaceae bacterium]PWL36852.1 MAG: FAD-dependent oxidoreductase [Marivita sp. XM-24bin2]
MAMPEITVRGAGIFGLSIAWVLTKRGARVQVVDPFGAGSGSSGGLVGALAPHVPENWNDKKAFQLESLLMAETFWTEVQEAGGVDSGYGRTGRLQPIADDHALELARARCDGARTLWQGRAVWEVITADKAGDFAPLSPSGFLIRDTLTGRMHPRQACAALVAALRAEGVEVVAEAQDRGAVIWATGWRGLLTLSEDIGKSVGAGIKGQSVALAYNVGPVPQVFVDGLHIIPHANGTVAIGSTSERAFDSPDGLDAQCDELMARAIVAMPVLADAPVVDRWAGVRPRARSRAPMLGAWPGRDGHFIANGGFKIGFGMAPKVAEVMADLVLEGRDMIPEGFRVEASM